MTKKPTIRKPTHELVHDGVVYAVIRCGDWKPAIKLLSTGETVRSASSLLDCDLLMGRWQAAIHYLFGVDCDHIPPQAVMVKVSGQRLEEIPGALTAKRE